MYYLHQFFSEESKFISVNVDGGNEYHMNVFDEIPKFCRPFTEEINPPNKLYRGLIRIFKIDLSNEENYKLEKNSDDSFLFINYTGEVKCEDIGTYIIDSDSIVLNCISNEGISKDCSNECLNSLQYMINICMETYSLPHVIVRTLNLKGLIENGFDEKSAKIFYNILIDYFFSDDLNHDSDYAMTNYYRTRAYLRKFYKLENPEDYDTQYIY